MAEVAQDAQQEFWRSPAGLETPMETPLPPAAPEMAEACAECGTEFMIGARFCHSCGEHRPLRTAAAAVSGDEAAEMASVWSRNVDAVRMWAGSTWTHSLPAASKHASSIAAAWRKLPFPAWVQYLHFHEIKRWIGLPTAALIAFIVGMGCVFGAIAVSFLYRASNLAEFQAIQMWRIEWLLAATASFVAGILLKRPDRE